MTGIIILWYGPIVNIPPGWQLCDGTNGTPDLQNSFLIGAGSTYAVGANAGAVNHTHDFTTDSHFHPNPGGTDVGPGSTYARDTSHEVGTGTTDADSSLPPYHSLAYIQRMVA